MSVTFRIGHFEGPLDLLSQLIEQEKLDISEISLAAVAEQFASYLNESRDIPLEEVADFLVVAAKLMYVKSKLLFPSLTDEILDEGPDLETQLRRYRAFMEASKRIDATWKSGQRSFARPSRIIRRQDRKFVPPEGFSMDTLGEVMRRLIMRLEPLRSLPQTAMKRALTIQDKIRSLLQRIRTLAQTTFKQFVGGKADKAETVLSFLAMLELIKQRFIHASQDDLFADIAIKKHPEAPTNHPLAETYI